MPPSAGRWQKEKTARVMRQCRRCRALRWLPCLHITEGRGSSFYGSNRGETNMGRPLAMKLAFILFTLLLCAGCGGTNSTQTPPPNGSLASGAWQFNQSQPSNEGTLLDFNLSQSGTQISAVGSTSCFDYGVNQPPYSGPGGLEGVVMDGAPTCGGISGSISGNSVTITWNTDTTFTGTLNSNGSITGTTSNNGATNSFTASPVSSLVPNGTYSGTLSEGFSGDIVLTTDREANSHVLG